MTKCLCCQKSPGDGRYLLPDGRCMCAACADAMAEHYHQGRDMEQYVCPVCGTTLIEMTSDACATCAED